MLHYLGPSFPNGPVGSSLPPAQPGTMPQGVPGIPPSRPPAMPNIPAPRGPMPGQGGPPPPASPGGGPGIIQPRGGAPNPQILAAIAHKLSNGQHGAPLPPEYTTTTQDDGSVILHIKLPNGQPGRIVKVLPPIKTGNTPK